MNGYEPIFNTAAEEYKKNKEKYNFFNFRSCLTLYQFIVNNDPNPDGEAITLAYTINKPLFIKYLTIPKPNIGYASNPEWYSQCDNLDSRHVMMSVILIDVLLKTKKLNEIKHIVEIGGGFGNWARLHSEAKDLNFDKWTIIDIPHVIALQKWYLKQTLSDAQFEKIEFVSVSKGDDSDTTITYDQWLPNVKNVDLILATHSLSEISYDAFLKYLPLLQKSNSLFYCYHKDKPHPFLISDKKNEIEQIYNPVISLKSEKINVFNNFYLKK